MEELKMLLLAMGAMAGLVVLGSLLIAAARWALK